MDVDLFDFALPDRLVALRPAVPRDGARMLVVNANEGIEHATVRDLPTYLRRGDAVVLNDSKVVAARLKGRRLARSNMDAEPKMEVLVWKRLAPDRFRALARPARKLSPGDHLVLGSSLEAWITACGSGGEIELHFTQSGRALDAAIAAEGEVPLPPYIVGRRTVDERDRADYQTIYARAEGSIAAPTAGLHFTPELLNELAERGIGQESVTLHVGPGTFLPVKAADTAQHRMHSEWAELGAGTAVRLNAARLGGGRIAAVGTTALRTLESSATPDGTLNAFSGETDIFITPGYSFRAAEILLTNFHLPRSTLFMLVCAFCGIETMKHAYEEAIRENYRFYSYGDACLLFRPA